MSVAARRYDPRMRYGIALPNFTDVASPEAIEAAAAVAERLGWDAVWTTDHVLVDRGEAAADYRINYDAIQTLAWVGARHPRFASGRASSSCPQRNAVVLAKELATLDALSGGRVVAGRRRRLERARVREPRAGRRFAVRGAYLSETIALWRHLWSGSSEPFSGRFHQLEDFVFGPLPPQGAALPIWIGGRTERGAAARRPPRDGYHSSATARGVRAAAPVIRAAADEAGRPMPALSARVRVEFGPAPHGPSYYAMRGTPEEVAAEVRKFAELGVEHLALVVQRAPGRRARRRRRAVRGEVAPLV